MAFLVANSVAEWPLFFGSCQVANFFGCAGNARERENGDQNCAAAIPNQATLRDIEQGKDVKLSNLQVVALGLVVEVGA